LISLDTLNTLWTGHTLEALDTLRSGRSLNPLQTLVSLDTLDTLWTGHTLGSLRPCGSGGASPGSSSPSRPCRSRWSCYAGCAGGPLVGHQVVASTIPVKRGHHPCGEDLGRGQTDGIC
jgi:hypothetical protein